MNKNTFIKYTKYTKNDLDSYVADKNACVQKINSTEHLGLHPKYLGDIREGIRTEISRKIGKYDKNVDGIILDFKNTTILNKLSAIRSDSPYLHMDVNTNFYVFKPQIGATVKGTVSYVSSNYISLVIYRVFNATIKLKGGNSQQIRNGTEISFIVTAFELMSRLPFIEGKLIENIKKYKDEAVDADSGISTEEHKVYTKKPDIKTKHESSSDSESDAENFLQPINIKIEKESNHSESDSSSSSPGEQHRRKMCPLPKNAKRRRDSSSNESEEELQKVSPPSKKAKTNNVNTSVDLIKKRISFSDTEFNSPVKQNFVKQEVDDSIDAILKKVKLEIYSEEGSEIGENPKKTSHKKKKKRKSVSTTKVKEECLDVDDSISKLIANALQNSAPDSPNQEIGDDDNFLENSIQNLYAKFQQNDDSIEPKKKSKRSKIKEEEITKVESMEETSLDDSVLKLLEKYADPSTNSTKKLKKKKKTNEELDLESSVQELMTKYSSMLDEKPIKSIVTKDKRKSTRLSKSVRFGEDLSFSQTDLDFNASGILSSTLKVPTKSAK